MLTLPPGIRVFAYVPPSDLRRGFDRLAAMVREHLRRDPLGGDLYLFRNRAGDRVKVFWHEPSGFWIFYKRLHRGTFRFPVGRNGACEIEIDASDLAMLLSGAPSAEPAKRR